MLEGEAVKKYFKDHPESVKALDGVRYQFKFPETFEPGEKIYRPLATEDIHFISFEGWNGERGVFAWFYPMGIPHYVKL